MPHRWLAGPFSNRPRRETGGKARQQNENARTGITNAYNEIIMRVAERDPSLVGAKHAQQAFWNAWNASTREQRLSEISLDQRKVLVDWLARIGRTDLQIVEVGCGAGWFCPTLKQFGHVAAVDLSDEVLARARRRVPDVDFIAGDVMALTFEENVFDVIVAIETLAHIEDQDAFVAKLARMLRPGGLIMLASQNRTVLERHNAPDPLGPGVTRRWLSQKEHRALLERHFVIREMRTITPTARKGVLRLFAGQKAKRVWRAICGRLVERLLERAGLGRTIMILAERRD